MESDDTLTGSLADISLASLLQSLASNGRTGAVRFADGSEIWIHDGRVYMARNAASPPVESVLFGAGTASQAEITSLMQSSEGDVAAVLAERDPEAPAVLDRLLHEYNLTALFELVVPSDLGFEFESGSVHPIGPRFAEPANELLAQAEQRLEIWKQIATRIPNTNVVLRLSPSIPDGEDERLVTSDEWRYLSLLDGRASVADVINETGESAFRVCSSLYRLLLEGLVVEASG